MCNKLVLIFIVVTYLIILIECVSIENSVTIDLDKKSEIKIENDTKIVELSSNNNETQMSEIESRDGGGSSGGREKKKQNLLSRILPLMVIPFLVSSSMIPMMLVSLKVMLLKSLLVGKVAIILLAINALWRINNQGGVYSHNINLSHENKEVIGEHYGYNNGEEYGAYVNKRKRKR